MNRSLRARLKRLERDSTPETPTCYAAAQPVTDAEAREALQNWRELVALGRASIIGRALYPRTEPMTTEQWIESAQAAGHPAGYGA